MTTRAAITPQSFTSFGELLRYLRERVELSQKELAAQVGYHYSYMSRIEKNQHTPDSKTLMARFVPALGLDGEPQWTARLLVIDNLEHIIEAASYFPNLLMGAPNVKILATSREALHVTGEFEFPILPLPLPQSSSDQSEFMNMDAERFESLSRFASVQLFAQRAQAVQPTFKLTHENISAIVEICRQLDGLPLAIELATARVKTLMPQAMLQQLNRRLEWLARGSRDSIKQTLRGTIEWSYNLLSEPERVVLRRLSAFADGCTLRAAESICSDPIEDASEMAIRREDVLDLIVKLIDKSLVTTDIYAALVEKRISTESISLLEPDTLALNNLIETGKNKLGGKSFKQIIEKSKSLRVEDIIASELPAAA